MQDHYNKGGWYCKCSNNLAHMGYNRRNILRRIVEVQNITLEYTRKGVTQKWVYENVIYPRFLFSIATYNSYLGINARAELKKIEEAEAKQLKIEF